MIETNGGHDPTHHELLTRDIRDKLPRLYGGEKLGVEAKALVKFFSPSGNWTWYASEFDGNDVFFGLVSGFEVELGYFSLSELEQARDRLGWSIERDLNFQPTTLRELMEAHEQGRAASSASTES